MSAGKVDMGSNNWGIRGGLLLLVALTTALLVAPSGASAAGPPPLYQTPLDEIAGFGAGQLQRPTGIGADPNSGHIFVADGANNRVSEFDAWGTFIKAWGWGVANKDSELQTCGPGADPPTATCRAGLAGSGAGQFNGLSGGLAVTSDGDIWVADLLNNRVQKFDSAGQFQLMVGNEVDKGPNHAGNVCTAAYIAAGEICGGGSVGFGPGAFSSNGTGIQTPLAVGPSGNLFVGDKGRIEEFSSDGSFLGEIVLGPAYESKYVKSLARTADGGFFALMTPFSGDLAELHIRKFASNGAEVASIPLAARPLALAIDNEGNLFVSIRGLDKEDPFYEFTEVIEFGPSGEPVLPFEGGFALRTKIGAGERSYSGLATNVVTSEGGDAVYLLDFTQATKDNSEPYRASLNAFGSAPVKWDPPIVAPTIVSQYAKSVGEESASVVAEINPHFWSDTTYSVEYGIGKCSEGNCTETIPIPPAALPGGVVNEPIKTMPLELTGLVPGTTYSYRVRAQSSGGGPAIGVGDSQEEGTFRTRVPYELNLGCPNQAFRTGAAALLPDCRAYEMVSPADKNGSGIKAATGPGEYRVQYVQGAVDGDSLTFTSYRAFGDAQSAPYGVQYLASRSPGGWASRALNPPKDGTGDEGEVASYDLDTEFASFSDDLSRAWLENRNDPPLTPDGVSGIVNLYERNNDSGGYRALTNQTPTEVPDLSEVGEIRFEGHAEGADVAAFSSKLAMTPDAAATEWPQVYASVEGQLHLVSVLPNGEANTIGASVGSNPLGSNELKHGALSVDNAISRDGSRIFWTSVERGMGEGKLYVRIDNSVTQQIAAGEVYFRKATPSGSEVLYERFKEKGGASGNLYRYNVQSKKPEIVAGRVLGVLGASEDLSRIYFVSEDSLAPGSVDGAFNLYLDEAGQVTYITGLSEFDVGFPDNAGQNVLSRKPIARGSRVTPDGEYLAFASESSLLPQFDIVDQNSGKPDLQVYWFSASDQKLLCVSCDPSGMRPLGQRLRVPFTATDEAVFHERWAGAWLSTSDSSFHSRRTFSDDGARLFFNSFAPLVAADTNGLQDVYQWEAGGTGDCEAVDGCVSLISDGGAPFSSEFVDADPSGSNVFFETAASLVPSDPDNANDIYVARVGGGIAEPPPAPPACEGSACQAFQGVPPVPGAQTGKAAGGNPPDPKPSCGKGRRAIRKKGHWKCVSRKKKHGGAKQRSHRSHERTDKSRRDSR